MSVKLKRPLVILAVATAASLLITGIPALAPSAHARPGECRLETRWTSGGSTEHGALVTEHGIKQLSSVVCDATDYMPWGWGGVPGGDPSAGGTDSDPAEATVPAAPASASPVPPASSPAGAEPPCVPGANNVTRPGAGGDGGATGTGDILLDNLDALRDSGDLRIDPPGPSRFVSFDVNIGPSLGDNGPNPLEGLSVEEAAKSLNWPGGIDPEYTEVGMVKIAVAAYKLIVRVSKGDRAAGQSLRWMMGVIDEAMRDDVVQYLLRQVSELNTKYRTGVPAEIRLIIDEVWYTIDNIIRTSPLASLPDIGSAGVYADVAAQPRTRGGGCASGSSCGQVASVQAEAAAGLTAGGTWMHVTLTGTTNGTLIDRIKAMASPTLSCPPVVSKGVLNQENEIRVLDKCVGTVASARLLTREEIGLLSAAERTSLMNGLDDDPGMASVFTYDSYWNARGLPWPNATSGSGIPTIHFNGPSAEGRLSYLSLRNAGLDYVVVAAKDTAGVEHPFMVKLELKAQPDCTVIDGKKGPMANSFEPVVQDGTLQLQRNTSFTIDLKTLCTADSRDTYRVQLTEGIDGTTHVINSDGTITFTWSDPDVMGDNLRAFKVMAWDETTGVPSKETRVFMDVRDARSSCNDVEIDYDMSELKGAPLEIPMSCGMEGGISVLQTPVVRIEAQELEQTVDGGTFRTDGTTVTFTPSATPTDVSTVQMSPWDADPSAPARWHIRGASFSVDVRMSE